MTQDRSARVRHALAAVIGASATCRCRPRCVLSAEPRTLFVPGNDDGRADLWKSWIADVQAGLDCHPECPAVGSLLLLLDLMPPATPAEATGVADTAS